MLVNILDYKGIGGCKCQCGIDQYEKDGKVTIVLTELPNNTGTSVTNWFEELATTLYIQWLKRDYAVNDITWIEHYPYEERNGDSEGHEETWDLVLLSWTGIRFKSPSWKRIEPESLESYLVPKEN